MGGLFREGGGGKTGVDIVREAWEYFLVFYFLFFPLLPLHSQYTFKISLVTSHLLSFFFSLLIG